MHKYQKRRLFLAVLCALCPLTASAQQGLKLQTQPELGLTPPAAGEQTPLYIEADQLQGYDNREITAEGNVRLRRTGQAFGADWMRFDKLTDELTAIGSVHVEQGGITIEGKRLRYHLSTDRGYMEAPSYTVRPPQAATPTPAQTGRPPAPPGGLVGRGNAARIVFRGPGQYRVEQGGYTTCGPGDDDWFIRAHELDIDRNRDVGVAHGASVVFLGRTIFYSPYLSFSLNQERKSGFLLPHYGNSNTSGLELTLPYYWNIAPNLDATFYPRYMTKRGLQLSTDFRYLEPNYRGMLRLEYLPHDQQYAGNRYAYFLTHTQTFSNGWLGMLNLNGVSDNTYFRDLSTSIALTSQSLLPREGTLARGGTWGGTGTYVFTALAQSWQTLQADPLSPITPPYNRLPQLSLTAYRQGALQSEFDFQGSYTNFQHPTLVSGQRLVLYPSFSLPLQNSYAHFTPKIGLNVTHYMLDPNTSLPRDQTRALPIITADTGLVFERNTRLGHTSYVTTLEPRLYYVYIPYRNQSQLPNFDSGLQDINFATIFSDNQFSGQDRINDANQVTVGITSRLIESKTGIERLRAGLAQRYYFESQRVTIPGVPARSNQTTSSDLLAVLSGTVAPHWTVDTGWQYSTDLSQTKRLNISTRYAPEPGKVLNLAYRYTGGLVKQTDVSTQWPFAGHWTALARWNYSLQDDRTLESLGGIEYDAGCWAFRVVAQRFAVATGAASTTIFLQLDLNGVSHIGSNALDTLRSNIGGYAQPALGTAQPQSYFAP